MKTLVLSVILFWGCIIISAQAQKEDAVSSESDQLQLIIPRETWEPLFFGAIDDRAKIGNLETLRSVPLSGNDIEVRIWYGFGLTRLRGFVIKRTGMEWTATYLLEISQSLSKSEYQKRLHRPKSGWRVCWRRLERAGILRLPDAPGNGCNPMIFDGMSYVVEFNHDRKYRTYHYGNPRYAKCPEAKRMIKIGKIISKEFGLNEMARAW